MAPLVQGIVSLNIVALIYYVIMFLMEIFFMFGYLESYDITNHTCSPWNAFAETFRTVTKWVN